MFSSGVWLVSPAEPPQSSHAGPLVCLLPHPSASIFVEPQNGHGLRVVSGLANTIASKHHPLDSCNEVACLDLAANIGIENGLLGAARWRHTFEPAVCDGGLNMFPPLGLGRL